MGPKRLFVLGIVVTHAAVGAALMQADPPPVVAVSSCVYAPDPLPPFQAQAELARITDVRQNAKGFANYQDWINNTQLEQKVSLEDYSVSNRGLRSGLVGTPEQVADRIRAFEDAGVDLLLLQFSPQLEEMERFAEEVIPLVQSAVLA